MLCMLFRRHVKKMVMEAEETYSNSESSDDVIMVTGTRYTCLNEAAIRSTNCLCFEQKRKLTIVFDCFLYPYKAQ